MSDSFSGKNRADVNRYKNIDQVTQSLRAQTRRYHFLQLEDATSADESHQHPDAFNEDGLTMTINGRPGDIIEVDLRSGWTARFTIGLADKPARFVTAPPDGLVGSGSLGAWEKGVFDYKNDQGLGTIEQQMFITAGQMLMIIMEHGWRRIHIADGSENMKWAFWTIASYNKVEVTGYSPSEEEMAKSGRVLDLVAQQFNFQHELGQALEAAKNPAVVPIGPGGSGVTQQYTQVGAMGLDEAQVKTVKTQKDK